MGKQPFISHSVNGYSRYDMPENKAFSVTPGIIYPVRIQFVNARDRVTLHQGIDVRSNPLGVPSFNPYVLRLHRFWVPLQLYHPEMRVNSSKFDMNNLTYNFIPSCVDNRGSGGYTSFMYPRAGTSAFLNRLCRLIIVLRFQIVCFLGFVLLIVRFLIILLILCLLVEPCRRQLRSFLL